jgi:hypothetical protein
MMISNSIWVNFDKNNEEKIPLVNEEWKNKDSSTSKAEAPVGLPGPNR